MKTCEVTGEKVRTRLKELGLETPMAAIVSLAPPYTEELKVRTIAEHFTKIMQVLGLDLKDDSLQDTPNRVAKMFVKEIFTGLDYKNFPKCTIMKNKMNYNQMLVEEKIAVKSFCEHHFVAIDGYATVAYIPGDHVIGLSKLNRIVEFFSRRPQVQERLTEQIFEAIRIILGTEDVAVVIRATHLCVRHRGVEDANSLTTTSKLGGAFEKDPTVRAEFFALAKGA